MCGSLAQWIEQPPSKRSVVGSIPTGPVEVVSSFDSGFFWTSDAGPQTVGADFFE